MVVHHHIELNTLKRIHCVTYKATRVCVIIKDTTLTKLNTKAHKEKFIDFMIQTRFSKHNTISRSHWKAEERLILHQFKSTQTQCTSAEQTPLPAKVRSFN